jgi:putative transposase
MPRTARASVGGICYHVINRGNGRDEVFHESDDYDAFVALIGEANERVAMRVLAYCLMPNHFHLVLWPREDGDLSRWMQWLMTSHVRRYHRHYGGSGHVWQGRFKAFPIQQDEHLLVAMRYVERNALRARLVRRAENWAWSSVRWHKGRQRLAWLHEGPVDRGRSWVADVNAAMTGDEEEALRKSVNRGTPWGSPAWQKRIAGRLGIESSLRPRGRPRKERGRREKAAEK